MTEHVIVLWFGLLFGLTGIGGTFAVVAKFVRGGRGGLR